MCQKGHSGLRYVTSRGCVQCSKERSKTEHKINYDKDQYRNFYQSNIFTERLRSRNRYITPHGRALSLMKLAKKRAKNKGIIFSLTSNWFEERLKYGKCELSGLEFDFLTPSGPYAPSVDRIDSTKGYEVSNCRVILWALNAAYGKWGKEIFDTIYKNIFLNSTG